VLLLSALARWGDAQEVFVHAESDGAGILRARGADCLLIAPNHVVGNATWITVVGPLRFQGSAQLFRRSPGDDLALLRLANASNLECRAWQPSDTLNALLRSVTDGVLKTRRADGSMVQMPVYVLGYNDQTIEVAPRLPSSAIHRTMSGSTLYLGRDLAGMLDSTSGVNGIVARIDRVYATVQSFLGPVAITNALPPVSVTRGAPISDPPTVRTVHVRSKPTTLHEHDAPQVIKRLGMYDSRVNPLGPGVDNQYRVYEVPRGRLSMTGHLIPDSASVLVTDIGPAAAETGIRERDVILSVAGQRVPSPLDMAKVIRGLRPDTVVPIELRRDGKGMTLQVRISEGLDSVVTDNTTGLMWEIGEVGRRPNDVSWAEAENEIEILNYLRFGGYTDWRLPTLEEALTLMEPTAVAFSPGYTPLHIHPLFGWQRRSTWTSDHDGSIGWLVDFERGIVEDYLSTALEGYRAVR